MADIVSPEKRSVMMSGIKGKNTKPEIIIRKALFKKGFRYRLHGKNLPGKPDLVLKKYNTVILVHGCYWHGHENCHLFRYPKSKQEFWKEKIGKNIERDLKNEKALLDSGWNVIKVWECALKGKNKLPLDAVIQEIETGLQANSSLHEIRGTAKSQ